MAKMQGKTCEDTLIAVANNVMNEDWKTKGGSIWNHGQERSASRVKCRATTCQLVQLVKFMEEHKELAVAHQQPCPDIDRLWDELAEHINQFGPPKTSRQCKTTWRDLRKRAFAMVRGQIRPPGRAMHGMAPKIIRIIEASGGLPPTLAKVVAKPGALNALMKSLGSEPPAKPSPKPSQAKDPLAETSTTVKPDKTSSGDHVIIRVTDKLNSKTNVLNRFSVRDGHFENNVIVKEEHEEQQADEAEEDSSENMETDAEPQTEDTYPEVFPEVTAVPGTHSNEDTSRALLELNQTLRKFTSEYAERTQLMRDRLELERARLQFDVEVFNSKQKANDDS